MISFAHFLDDESGEPKALAYLNLQTAYTSVSTSLTTLLGVQNYATLCVDDSGKLQLDKRATSGGTGLNAWNVDATRIVFDHSDIYKGRVATLIADLLYGQDKKSLSAVSDTNSATDSRCMLGSEP
jgi:hypothetical protein